MGCDVGGAIEKMPGNTRLDYEYSKDALRGYGAGRNERQRCQITEIRCFDRFAGFCF